jgi:hypothetical protein
MGRVFTWDEVLRKEVPTPDDFRFARSALELRFLGESSILYVLLFGSVVRGDQNCRSDFDCLVGINLLTKVQMPNLALLYGAMLAGADFVLSSQNVRATV